MGGLFDFEALDRDSEKCTALSLSGSADTCPGHPVDATSREGKRLIGSMTPAAQRVLARWRAVWRPQLHGHYCAPASALAALRYMGFGAGLSQDSIYHDVIKPHGFFTYGVSFDHGCRLMQILGVEGLEVQRFQSYDVAKAEDRLAEDLTFSFQCGETVCILANYWRPPDGGGHWSPLVGFAEGQVLILDTNAAKGPPHWLPLRTMARALCRHNDKTGLPRGYLVVRRRDSQHASGT